MFLLGETRSSSFQNRPSKTNICSDNFDLVAKKIHWRLFLRPLRGCHSDVNDAQCRELTNASQISLWGSFFREFDVFY